MKTQIEGKMAWVNYHHLYCFYIIAQQGSITLASKKLGIGQSALSIQMKQFEAQLGYSLFERSHRKIEINERGKLVLSYAKEIFRLGGEMVQTLHDRPKSDRVRLQIGALDTIPKHLTVKIVNHALMLKSQVTVVEGKLKSLVKDLIEHRIDLVVTNYLPQTIPGQIFAKKIARLPLYIVGAKPFVGLREGFPRSLEGQPFILPTADSDVRHQFESYCSMNDLKIDRLVETQDIMVQKLLAVEQNGLTIMPEFAVAQFIKTKQLYLIGKLPRTYEEIYLLSASRRIKNPAASQLMQGFELIGGD